MTKFKIVFDRKKCIGSFSCVRMDGKNWRPTKGKAELVGSTAAGETFEKKIDEKDANFAKSVAAVCPSGAIKVVKE